MICGIVSKHVLGPRLESTWEHCVGKEWKMVGVPPSYGELDVWSFEIAELFESGLSVELSFVNANAGAANVVVPGLMIAAGGCGMGKREFDVYCRCLLSAGKSV